MKEFKIYYYDAILAKMIGYNAVAENVETEKRFSLNLAEDSDGFSLLSSATGVKACDIEITGVEQSFLPLSIHD